MPGKDIGRHEEYLFRSLVSVQAAAAERSIKLFRQNVGRDEKPWCLMLLPPSAVAKKEEEIAQLCHRPKSKYHWE